MKLHKNILRMIKPVFGSFACALLMTISGCTNDKDLKAQITGLAKSDVNFAGVEYMVDAKTVTLTGRCPSQKAKDAVEQTIQAINIVNGINNQIQIAPVTLDASFDKKLEVDSILAAYPGITAEAAQNSVILKGSVKKPELAQLLTGIEKLNLQKVQNRLSVN